MSKFEVDYNKLRKFQQEQKDIEKNLDKVIQSLNDISSKLNMNDDVLREVNKSLKKASNKAYDIRKRTDECSHALKLIADTYEKTEKKMNSQVPLATLPKKLFTAVKNAENTLDKIKSLLGYDSAMHYSEDPVNLVNGNYIYEKSFFDINAHLPLHLRLFYNSIDENSSILSKGWNHNFNIQLRKRESESLVEIIFEDGSEAIFRAIEGSYQPLGGSYGELTYNTDGYSYKSRQQIVYEFNEEGQLLKEVADEYELKCQYDNQLLIKIENNQGDYFQFDYEAGMLTQVTDHTNRTLKLIYENNHLVHFISPSGRSNYFTYNKEGRIVEVHNHNKELVVRNTYKNNVVVKQEFPDGGLQKFSYDEAQKETTLIEQNNNKVTFQYDEHHRDIKHIYSDGEESFSYNNNNQKTEYIDKNGNRTQYAYDARGNLISVVNALNYTLNYNYTSFDRMQSFSIDDALLYQSEYNELELETKRIDALGHERLFDYDEQGRLTQLTYEDGSTEQYVYSDNGDVVEIIHVNGGHSYYEYDKLHRVIKSTNLNGYSVSYEYDVNNHLISVTNENGDRKHFKYNELDQLVETIDFDGSHTYYTYNNINKLASMTDPDGHTTQFFYNKMWKLERIIYADGSDEKYVYDQLSRLSEIIDAKGHREKAIYDPQGNLLRRIKRDGGTYEFKYDALNRPIEITDPVGVKRSVTFDAFGNVVAIQYPNNITETFDYDLAGNLVRYKQRNNHVISYKYNALGLMTEASDEIGIIEKRFYYPGGLLKEAVSTNGVVQHYDYDLAGNLLRLYENDALLWKFDYDKLGRVTYAEHVGVKSESYQYDALDRITLVTDAEGHTKQFKYSDGGLLIGVIDANGFNTRYAYDKRNRLTSVIQSDDNDVFELDTFNRNNKKQRITSYNYDLNSNITSIVNPENIIQQFTYDDADRLISRLDEDQYLTQFTYNLDDTVKSILLDDGRQVDYVYDDLKNITAINDWLGTMNFKKDSLGQLLECDDQYNNKTIYTYDQRQNLTSMLYPDGKKVEYHYNAKNQLTSVNDDKQTVQFTYSPLGKLLTKEFNGIYRQTCDFLPNGRLKNTKLYKNDEFVFEKNYNFNNLGLLSEEHDVDKNKKTVKKYQYDNVGRLLSVTKNNDVVESFVYNNYGNRIAYDTLDQHNEYHYNRLDQLVESHEGQDLVQYDYDLRGNLTSVMRNGQEQLSLTYDALNMLSLAKSPEATTNYTYNAMLRRVNIATSNKQGQHQSSYIYDYNKMTNNLLVHTSSKVKNDYVNTNEVLFKTNNQTEFFMNDDATTVLASLSDIVNRTQYSAFGQLESAWDINNPAFSGFMVDETTGFYYAVMRDYDPLTGRFTAPDPIACEMYNPENSDAYAYCHNDPINYFDPVGLISVILAAGLVGAVKNLAMQAIGDTIKTVTTGKLQYSGWKDYVGTAAGGFAEGSVLVATGGNEVAASAAGSAVETLTTDGLKMLTHEKGYENFTGNDLLIKTAASGISGAVMGIGEDFMSSASGKEAITSIKDKVFKSKVYQNNSDVITPVVDKLKKYNPLTFKFNQIKIKGVTSGQGNMSAVWKGIMTKAMNGTIKNVSLKTLIKGVFTHGLLLQSEGVSSFVENTVEDIITDGVEHKIKSDIMLLGTGMRLAENLICHIDV